MFAGILPICAGGNAARVSVIKDLPVWQFMGTKDQIVPIKAVDGGLCLLLNSPLAFC
jgi:predicted peptidase